MRKWLTQKRLVVVALSIVIVTFLVLLAYEYATVSRWDFERLSGVEEVYPYSEIKIVGSDELCVAQWGTLDGHYSLVYSAWSDSEPDPTAIFTFNDTDSFRAASMVVDAGGQVHVFIAQDIEGLDNDGIWYANDTNGEWEFARLDVSDNVVSLKAAVDQSGKFHLVYSQDPWAEPLHSNDVKYATDSSGHWTVETLFDCPGDDSASVGGLAFDDQGVLHAVFHAAALSGIKYATLSGGTWSVHDPLTDYTIAGSPSMAVGSDGTVHVSLYVSEGGSYSLAYASLHDGAWDVETLAEAGNTYPSGTAVALGQAEAVHIAYYRHYYYGPDAPGNDYSSWHVSKTDGPWSTERVSSSYSMSGSSTTSIAVDGNGKGHMVFSSDIDASGLSYCTYATKKPGQAVLEESIIEALRNTAILGVPLCVVLVAAYAVVGRRGE